MSAETLKARLLFWISVVIIAPILTLLLVELVLRIYGVLELGPFLRELRWLSYEQANMIRKLVSLAALGMVLLVVVGLMTYGITSVFEILREEPAQRARGDSRKK